MINAMPAPYAEPSDFDDYWFTVRAELDQTPARPEIDPIPMRETDFATLYGVRIISIGSYRLFGYLSVPKSDDPDAKFPAIYWPPAYASVLQIIPQGTANEIRRRFVTFSCAGRGQRNADKPYAAMIPGLLTEGIDSPRGYIFRSIAADAARGMQFLMSRPEIHWDRVAMIGNDIAMIAAAIIPIGADFIVCAPALFADPLAAAARTDAYPLEEYNDYLRAHPDRRAAVAETLSYFDLRAIAARIAAPTLLMAGPEGSPMGPEALSSITETAAADIEIHPSQQSSYLDGLHQERWIHAQLGLGDPILPEHWR